MIGALIHQVGRVERVLAKRAINSNAAKRGKVLEVIVRLKEGAWTLGHRRGAEERPR